MKNTIVVDIYESEKNPKGIIVPTGSDIKKIKINDPDFSQVSLFKKSIKIEHGSIAGNVNDIIKAIESEGYYISHAFKGYSKE